MTTTFDDWLRQLAAAGKGGVCLGRIDRGLPLSLTLAFGADWSADDFAASLRLEPDATGDALAEFTVSVGSYAEGVTPVTFTLTQMVTSTLPEDADGNGVVTLAMDIVRLPASGLQHRIMGGTIEVLGRVTDYVS